MAQAPDPRSERIDIRISPEAKRLLQEAATTRHKTVSEFVLDSALHAAEETVLERRHFRLDAKRWAAFIAALDAPPSSHPRLERLLIEPSAFD
jgi:uncharacterized protein (DUF1778 family)